MADLTVSANETPLSDNTLATSPTSGSELVYKTTRFPVFYQLYHTICDEMRVGWLAVLVLLGCAGLILHREEILLLEHVHTWLFPLVAVIVWRIPRQKLMQMPLPLILACVVGWGACLGFLYGEFTDVSSASGVVFTRLDNDSQELVSRSLVRRYDQIAATYGAPSSDTLHRTFASDKKAFGWLKPHRNVQVMLYGNSEWVTLRITPSFPASAAKVRSVRPSRKLSRLAYSYGVRLDRRTLLFRLPGTSRQLVLVNDPEGVAAPVEPSELILHVLAWIARGLDADRIVAAGSDYAAEVHAVRSDAFREAANIQGPWRSHSPRALADFLLGTYTVFSVVDLPLLESMSLRCSMDAFRSAAGYLKGADEPHITAAVFNNAAAAQLLLDDGAESVEKAKKWLARAAGQFGSDGEPVFSARVAMINLQTLEQVYPE